MRSGGVALLTGATGFLGSHIVKRLLFEGVEVRALTSGSSKLRLGAAASSVNWFGTDDMSIEQATRGVNQFFNLAVLYDRVSNSTSDIDAVNIELPLRVIRALSRCGEPSVCVLGDTFYRKFPPTATTQRRYTVSKSRLADQLRNLPPSSPCRVAILRIEQVYGPGESLDKAYPRVIRQMLHNTPRIPMTLGMQERDFIYVDDVAEAMWIAARADFTGCIETDCGSGTATPVRRVFELLKELTGSSSELCFGEMPLDQDIPHSAADTSWLYANGWRCTVSLEAGLRKFVTDVATRAVTEGAAT